MMDVLWVVTAAATLFQNKDLLMFEVKETIDILYTQLHVMKWETGEHLVLANFYSLFNKDYSLSDKYLKLSDNLVRQADFCSSLVHGQVENLEISTPLILIYTNLKLLIPVKSLIVLVKFCPLVQKTDCF